MANRYRFVIALTRALYVLLGFWQLQLPSHFSRHVPLADLERPSLGSYTQR